MITQLTLALPPGQYRTPAGSHVEIFGTYGGAVRITFDWFEEGACDAATPQVAIGEGMLIWSCDCHNEQGEAALQPITTLPFQ